LAMEAAPEAHDFKFLGIRLGQADGGLDGLSTTTVELRLSQFTRRQRSDQLQQLGTVFRRKTADNHFANLFLQGRDELWMRVPKASDGDPGVEIEIVVAINVRQSGTGAMGHGQTRELGNALDAGREKFLLSSKEGERRRARDSRYTIRRVLLLGHTLPLEVMHYIVARSSAIIGSRRVGGCVEDTYGSYTHRIQPR